MRRRVANETERRLAGDVLAGAPAVAWSRPSCAAGWSSFGIGDEAAVLVFDLEHPAARAPRRSKDALRRRLPGGRRAARVGARELLCAVRRRRRPRPARRAAEARRALRSEARLRPRRGKPAGAAERAAPLLPRSVLRPRGNRLRQRQRSGSPPGATSAPSPAALDPGRRCAATLLRQRARPDRERRREYGGEPLRSLEAFIEQNGQWERARARSTPPPHAALPDAQGRRADRRATSRAPTTGSEFWLALRARELVGER